MPRKNRALELVKSSSVQYMKIRFWIIPKEDCGF